MREPSASREDPAPRLTPRALWRVQSVRALSGYRLAVRFMDGTGGEVDLAGLVERPDAGVFSALRDPGKFEQVAVVDGAVTWPNGQDLAPDAMYNEIAPSGRWVVR